MKKTLLITTMLLMASASAPAIDYQSTTDKVWGGRCFQELDGRFFDSKRTDGALGWPQGADGVTVVYCLRVPAGHVRADIVMTPRVGRTAEIRLAVVSPETGDTITTHVAMSDSTQTRGEQTFELMPDVVFPYDGWYRFELSTPERTNIRQINSLEFQREARQAVGDSPIFMAPSVHLFSYATSDREAPTGESYDWVYLEVMYPTEYEQPNTYVMSIGTDAGYSGVQSIWDGNGGYTHQVLFSVWDNGDTDSDPYLPDYLRSGALDTGPEVYITRFGGEGTGTSARYPTGHWWRTGEWVQFLLNGRPEQVEVEVTEADGTTRTVSYENTIESMWYKMADETEWHYIASLRESGRNHLYNGFYSFIENFTDAGGEMFRRAYFRNPTMRSTASGRWYGRNKVSFGHTQGDGSRFSRTDYGHGATDAYPNCFYMQTGGFVEKRDSASTFPLPEGPLTWTDTIDLVPLTAQVNRAIINSEAARMADRIYEARSSSGGIKALVEDVLAKMDCLGGYSKADLDILADVYNDGKTTDTQLLTKVLTQLAANARPLKYGIVTSADRISSFYTYIIRNAAGRGTLISKRSDNPEEGAVVTIGESKQEGALEMWTKPVNVVDNPNNWLILRSEKYKEYYIYQPSFDLWLQPGETPKLVKEPCAVSITRSSTGFLIGGSSALIAIDARKETPVGKGGSAGDGTRMELIHNYALDLPENVIISLLHYAEETVHGGSGISNPEASPQPSPEGKGAWFDLSGHPVTAPANGIYIRNGHKVYIR